MEAGQGGKQLSYKKKTHSTALVLPLNQSINSRYLKLNSQRTIYSIYTHNVVPGFSAHPITLLYLNPLSPLRTPSPPLFTEEPPRLKVQSF